MGLGLENFLRRFLRLTMSSFYEKLVQEIDTEITLRNSEVITRSIIQVKPICPKCKYPQNAELFNDLLDEYTRLRKIYYKNNYTFTNSDYWTKLTFLRQELKHIWPCADCITLFNPTDRRKHQPKNNPKNINKNFLEIFAD